MLIPTFLGRTPVGGGRFERCWGQPYSLGIPKNGILLYETALKTGKFVLIAHGSADDASKAKEILNRTKPKTLEHHV